MQRSKKIAATIACGLLTTGIGVATAVQQPAYMVARPSLEVANGPSVRAVRDIRTDRMPQAMARPWAKFRTDHGASWTAVWDTATGVPNRIYGSGISVPGSVADPDIAARFAEQTLERHMDLLAPGCSQSDFTMVSNVVHRGMRSIGFLQTYHGMPVLGGQVSFRFKNDRMFVIGTEALPNVDARHGLQPIANTMARSRAKAWMTDTSSTVSAGVVDGPFVLPLVGTGHVDRFVTVMRVRVDAQKPIGQWDVYVDAQTGDPVAREQTLHFADGVVQYEASVRQPATERQTYPAQNTNMIIDSDSVQTDAAGNVTWTSSAAGALTTSVQGPLVDVDNTAGPDATAMFTIDPSGTVVWGDSNEFIDAQINAFVHARIVKDYSRSLNPGLEWLDETLPVNVNIDETCNAFSDGNSINFFIKNDQCQNTARLADVVYHEFGHSLHANSVIQGVGAFTSAHSEGLADYLAATITDDPAMGRGFFLSDGPLRHIDPTGKEHIWPIDVAGPHFTGLIFAGAMWDLRKVFVDKYGADEGVRLANQLYYATLQRASSIPSTYVEVLAEDDDDGDLSNGTPNVCDINVAFAAHGLRLVAAEVSSLSAELPSPDGHDVELKVTGLFDQCPGDSVDTASIDWHLRGDEEIQTIEMDSVGENDYLGTIPEIAEGNVVHYSVRVTFNDGLSRVFPDNPADTEYQFYVGETVPLYCTGFETDPFLEGWEHGLASGEMSEGADDWHWGAPLAGPESGDPPTAFAGDSVIGNDLGGGDFNGQYQEDKINFAISPSVEVGQYSDVHLQYWRWLNVEDAFFDQATIFVNNHQAWQNLNSDNGNNSALHHQDREWRFQDVPVSQFVEDGKLFIRYELSSDSGLNMGGWTIDEFCIMANANSICGDGEITGVETCDDGDANNDDEPDACRTTCKQAFCGDGIVDSSETCDDGNDNNDDSCNNACNGAGGVENGDCGCVVDGRGAAPTGGLILLAFVIALRRRRRST